MGKLLVSCSIVAFGSLLGFAAGAQAGDPFLITAQTTSGTSQNVNVSGNSLPDLLGNLLKSQSQFSSLSGRDISGSLRYGGVNNAVTISKNSSNTAAVVSIPAIGFTKTFTASNESDLEHQIKDFARKNGATIYGEFLRSLNASTNIGVTDGNPLATTALLANQAYTQFGLQPTPWPPGEGMPNPLDLVATPNVQLDLNGGYSHSDTSSGYYAGGAFSFGFKFGERVGLVFATPFEYRNVQGADVFNIGEEISLPIMLLLPQGNGTLGWMLTPTFFAGAAGSVDLAAGGTFLGGGITSSLSYRIDTFIITLADGFSYFHGFPISVGQYKFDTNLDQEVLKNGVKVTKFFGDNFFVDAGLTYTNFLQRAAIKQYWSPEAGIGVRFNSNAGVRLGYSGDFSHDFVDHGAQLQLYFNY